MSRRWLLLLFVPVVAWAFDRHYRFFDMAIYQGAVRWWLAGGDLYGYHAPVRGALGFTYPPFAALVLTPTALVPLQVAGWVITVLSLLALAGTLGLLVRGKLLIVGVVAALATEPIRQTLGLGQVNLLLFALVVVDLLLLGRAGSRWTGVGIGIATAIKLTPGLFIVYLLATRRWRAAGVAAGTSALLTVAAALVAPRETMQYFGFLMWETARVGAADAVANQSLAGLLARVSADHLVPRTGWLLLCLAAVVAGLHRAARAHAAGDEVTALALTGLTANLITPVAWTHHLVFLPVALIALARSPLRHHRIGAAACFALAVLSPIWWVDPAAGGVVAALAADTFVLMMLALVFRLPVRSADVPAARLPALSAQNA